MSDIIKLDLIKTKNNNLEDFSFEKKDDLFLAFGKYDYLKINKIKFNNFSDILLQNNGNNEEYIKDKSYYNSYYLSTPLIKFDQLDITECLKESVYCFISLIDGNKIENDDIILKNLESLKKDNLNYQLYKTLNGFDYVLIACSNKYDDLSNLIYNIRYIVDKNKCPIFYNSYSILCVKKMEGSENEKIDYITINAKLTDIKSIPAIIKEIENINENFGKDILSFFNSGNSDCCFVLKNCDTKTFFDIYKNFFLINLNAGNIYFNFLDTKFSDALKKIEEICLDVELKKNNNDKLTKKIESLKNLISINMDKICNYGNIYYYTFNKIYDNLSKIDYKNHYAITYESIVDTLISFLKKLTGLNNNYSSISEQDFCLVCNSINRILETIDFSRNQFGTNESQFHDSIYNFPYKFLEFYNKFVKYVLSIFQEEYKYDFLITPSLITEIQMTQLYDENKPTDRILIINIPVNLMYKPDLLLPMIVHDIGHYYGQDIRQRELRRELVFSNLFSIILTRLLNNINFIRGITADECIIKIRKKYDDYMRNRYIEEFSQNNFLNHRDYLIPFLQVEVENFLILNRTFILNAFLELLINNDFSIVESQNIVNNISDNIDKMLYYEMSNVVFENFKVKNIKIDINDLIQLYYEGFADIFALRILNMKDDYLEKSFEIMGSGIIIKENETEDRDDLKNIRLKILTDIDKVTSECSQKKYEEALEAISNKTIENSDNTHHFYENDEVESRRYSFAYDDFILYTVRKYLKICKESINLVLGEECDQSCFEDNNLQEYINLSFNEKNNETENIKEVQDVYNALIKDEENNMDNKIKVIENFIQ